MKSDFENEQARLAAQYNSNLTYNYCYILAPTYDSPFQRIHTIQTRISLSTADITEIVETSFWSHAEPNEFI